MPYRIAPVISDRPNDPFADPDRLRYPPAVRKSTPELLRLIPKAHRVLAAAAAVQASRKTAFEASAVLSAVDASKYRDKAVGSDPVSGSHQRMITEHPKNFSKKRKKCLHFGEKSDIIPLHLRNAQKTWGYSSAGRALEWHSRGQRFDPAYLHQPNTAESPENATFSGLFFILFSGGSGLRWRVK